MRCSERLRGVAAPLSDDAPPPPSSGSTTATPHAAVSRGRPQWCGAWGEGRSSPQRPRPPQQPWQRGQVGPSPSLAEHNARMAFGAAPSASRMPISRTPALLSCKLRCTPVAARALRMRPAGSSAAGPRNRGHQLLIASGCGGTQDTRIFMAEHHGIIVTRPGCYSWRHPMAKCGRMTKTPARFC